MNTEEVLNEIVREGWASFRGPQYYRPDKVADALTSLILLKHTSQENSVYNNVLSAVGNNHGGTYYPVAELALKYILITATTGNSEIARNCALDILFDLYATFVPEIGSYHSITEKDLERRVKQIIASSKGDFNDIISNSSESGRNKSLIKELLDCFEEDGI